MDTEFVRLDIEHEGQRWLIEGDVDVVLRRIDEEIEEDLLEEIEESTKTEEAASGRPSKRGCRRRSAAGTLLLIFIVVNIQ